MPHSSFVQTDFRGGIWSPTAQGKMDHPLYKTALNACLNALPSEDASWSRRPGFRIVGQTRYGLFGRLLQFRFGRDQAYQAELTAGFLRFVAGLTHVKDETSEPLVLGIAQDSPATVHVNAIPATWADGDIVMFDIASEPPSSYRLFGRQFKIANVNLTADTFTLKDPFTGANINGATIDWVPRATADTVQRVLTFTTPYTEADLPNLRIVQDSDSVVLILCPGRPPYALEVSGATQFTFAEADFIDGPYLDENETVTTLALSAVTGTVTVTASSTTNINNGDGFKSTDVGRSIWFQGGPPAWDNAVPYNKEDKVLGSDGNIYKSLISNNLNNNPTTDTGTKWEITSETVSVTWLEIATFVDTTHVTALIRGESPDSGTATIHWRLGVYSATTGYPTCGAYHEARLALAGAVPNRVDMSKSFKALEFSPTETDGTVSDDNGVSFTLNSKDSEYVSWMLSTEDGMIIGTLAGEWVFRASALDDPVSPTSAQARNPSTSGSANIEPVSVFGSPMHVQARGRKVMTHRRINGKYENVNHSVNAEGLGAPSIKELAWVQEPLLSFFCRRSDGVIVGAVHKVSQESENFTGWHEHEHGDLRKFEAMSFGPNFSGTSDSLFTITAAGTNPNASPRLIETMMPYASSGMPEWVAWHTDMSSTGWFIRRMIVANGDSFDGLRVFGLHDNEGNTVHPFIGGLDLGNFVVTNGSIDLPYAGTFTAAFLAALDDGTDYAEWGMHLRWMDAPITTPQENPRNSILVYDKVGDPAAAGTRLLPDLDLEFTYRLDTGGPGGGAPNIRVFNGLTGALLSEATTRAAIFPTEATHDLLSAFSFGEVWCHVPPDDDTNPRGALFGMSRGPNVNDNDVSLINANTLVEYDWVNINNMIPKQIFTVPYFVTNPVTFINQYAQIGIATGASAAPVPIRIWNLTENGPLFPVVRFDSLHNSTIAGETIEWGCRGWEWSSHTTWFMWGHDGNVGIGMSNATRIQISEWNLDAPSTISTRVIRTITPAEVDAGWTAFDQFTVTYDANDGMLVCHAGKNAAAASRVLKINPITGAIVWNVATPTTMDASAYPTMSAGPWRYDRWAYMTSAGVIQVLNLTDGTWSTLTGMATGFSSIGTQSWFDDFGPSLIVTAAFDGGVGSPSPSVNYIGDFAIADQPSWVTNYDRVWLGLGYTQDQDHREINADEWFVPVNFGVSFTSQGQLLRPDQGPDAGAMRGPAFGKKRRVHQYAISFWRAFNVRVGTAFTKMFPVKMQTPGGTPYAAPSLYSDITSDSLSDDYSYKGQICWEVTRQYPCTITAVGGYIETQDK